MPAYNAGKTLQKTHEDIPMDIVDEVILVDDDSRDDTIARARSLGISTFKHRTNRGYGGNQKSCYLLALERGADMVVMLHPDYQYDPRLIGAFCSMIVDADYDVVLGSRILCGSALKGGMPLWKYVGNRILTLMQNLLQGAKISEYHTGYRAFSSDVIRSIPFQENSDDFVFDNEFLAQILMRGYRVGELSCPARYFPEASSINFLRSVRYAFGVLRVSLLFFLTRCGIYKSPLFTHTTTSSTSTSDTSLLEPILS